MRRFVPAVGARVAKLALAAVIVVLMIGGGVYVASQQRAGTGCIENDNRGFGPGIGLLQVVQSPPTCEPNHSFAFRPGWQLPVTFLVGAVGLGLLIYLFQSALVVRRPRRIPEVNLKRLPKGWL